MKRILASTQWKVFLFCLVTWIALPCSSYGQIRLPKLVSDGMVLQRDADVRIWGWASPHEKISVDFQQKNLSAITDDTGHWEVHFLNLKPGGPYTMSIRGTDSVRIKDILVGEVWLCAGQSNMETPVSRVSPRYPGLFDTVNNSNIRQFSVLQVPDFKGPRDDCAGGSWKAATRENIMDFSAVIFFFGNELYQKYHVPIGLIKTSLGGSPAEAWISEEGLKEFPYYIEQAHRFRNDSLVNSIKKNDRTRSDQWYKELNQKDPAYTDQAVSWKSPEYSDAGWGSINIPGYWADSPLGNQNGSFWFRREFNLSATQAASAGLLLLGRIIDADSVFINGSFVGNTTYQYPPRRYPVKKGVLKEGKNVLVIRVINSAGKGGFVPDKPYELIIQPDTIHLTGSWQFKTGAKMPPMPGGISIQNMPVGLFNGIIHPVTPYCIRGIVWYQGESNTSKAVEYRKLLPALITDWRSYWKQGNIPFLIVQLPNYMEPRNEPSESEWAMLREAQFKALSLPGTALVVAIDLGEWNDIHPLNKKDVGFRLALAARKLAYGEKSLVSSGPLYQSMEIKGNRIILHFTSTGNGMETRDGKSPGGFAICGKDHHFVWADAIIKNNTLIVWSDAVADPVAVRYAWADNPINANLCNKERLPASPFRTDNW